MLRLQIVFSLGLFFATACDGEAKPRQGDSSPAAPTTVDSASGMAGMDHSKMAGAAANTVSDTSMAGMDHSKMPGMSPATSQRATAAPMPMDHANMPGMPSAAARTTAAPMAGMDHSQMQAVSAADQKFDRLLAVLLEDPVVKQRIQQDAILRRQWDDAAVKALRRTLPQ